MVVWVVALCCFGSNARKTLNTIPGVNGGDYGWVWVNVRSNICAHFCDAVSTNWRVVVVPITKHGIHRQNTLEIWIQYSENRRTNRAIVEQFTSTKYTRHINTIFRKSSNKSCNRRTIRSPKSSNKSFANRQKWFSKSMNFCLSWGRIFIMIFELVWRGFWEQIVQSSNNSHRQNTLEILIQYSESRTNRAIVEQFVHQNHRTNHSQIAKNGSANPWISAFLEVEFL